MEGVVVRNTGSWYVVRTDDGRLFSCKVKGNFRLRGIRSTNPVAVGDRVEIRPLSSVGEAAESLSAPEEKGREEAVALIADILPRRNYIVRKASNLSKQSHILAANVDQAVLLVTVAHPETNVVFVDRFLASAEAYRIPVVLLFNKTDLYDPRERLLMEQLMALYERVGYRCLSCSALLGEGTEELAGVLKDRTTLLSGNSGVGKSTLLNALIPGLEAATAEISAAHDTGQHTTTFSQMYALPAGGQIIDTPGIKGFGTFDMEPAEVGHYFREIFRESEACRFNNCTHTHEPHCAVRAAVAEGRIAESRYLSYLNMLDDKQDDKYRKAY